MALKCTTCGTNLVGQENFVIFDCPKCKGDKIVRCNKCKANSVPYTCTKCDFEGP